MTRCTVTESSGLDDDWDKDLFGEDLKAVQELAEQISAGKVSYSMYLFYLSILCIYSIYLFYVSILCIYSMYLFYVSILCIYAMHLLYVCLYKQGQGHSYESCPDCM